MASILVIDDDEFVRSLVTRALAQADHRVEVASDGATGLDLYRSGDFDLVVTDILMPGKEGIEFILELREEDAAIPVLAISGGGVAGVTSTLRDARMLGADATLPKPFDVEALQRAVRELLERARV